jgi:hypothetical protein
LDIARKADAIELIMSILREHDRALEELASKAERLIELERRNEKE